jgi:hypothetical protein
MDNPDIKSPEMVDESQWQAQLESLNHLVTSVLILLVIVSGTLSVYLLRQWQMARKDLAAIQPGALQIIADYNKERAPRMDAFIDKLKDYGRTHSDFVPILIRYGIVSNAPAVGGAVPGSAMPKK